MSAGYGRRWRVLERDAYTCRYCGARAPEVRLEVDHIVPRSRGGTNDYSNLVTSCHACNQGKKARDSSPSLSAHERIESLREGLAYVVGEFESDRTDMELLLEEMAALRDRLADYIVLAEEHGWFLE